VGVCFWAAPK